MLGREQIRAFVTRRLCDPPHSDQHQDLRSTIQKNTANTFPPCMKPCKPTNDKQDTVKAERNILQRLITACRAGREARLENILQHELMTVPLSLTATSLTLNPTNKSIMTGILTQQVEVSANITLMSLAVCSLMEHL